MASAKCSDARDQSMSSLSLKDIHYEAILDEGSNAKSSLGRTVVKLYSQLVKNELTH